MKDPDLPFDIRRILVALDASPHSLAALDAAANLAARMDAELSGIFVEDAALLRLAEAPLAREVSYFSSAEEPLSRASMESKLKAQSERARTAFSAAAQRARVEWKFRTVRGEVTAEVMAAANDFDLLAIGQGGWSVGRKSRAGSTALELATSSIPLLLLPDTGLPEGAPLIVYYDGSPQAKRGLLCALRLAEVGMDGLTVLLEAASKERAAALQDEAETVAPANALRMSFRQIEPGDVAGFGRALEAKNALLVLGGRELLTKLPGLDSLLAKNRMSLLLLGDSSGAPVKSSDKL